MFIVQAPGACTINSNSAITKTEREILECSFLQNCNENNETDLLNMAMGTMTKLSTAGSCSKIGKCDAAKNLRPAINAPMINASCEWRVS